MLLFRPKLSICFLDCDVEVISGDILTNDGKFKVEFALQHDMEEEFGMNYWASPDHWDIADGAGAFILDLGCEDSFDTVELVNTHNADKKNRATKRFKVFLR